MRSVVFCYAPEDADEVREIGERLEANCDVTVACDEGRIRAGGDLVDAAEAGLSADAAVVFFSPASVPERWVRERWEPVFCNGPRELGTAMAFVLLRMCSFPQVLRRGHFFDLSRNPTAGRRDLKRWLFSLGGLERGRSVVLLPELPPGTEAAHGLLDELECRLADRPGSADDVAPDVALAFAHLTRDDFDGVFWIDCANRGRPGIVGDVAHALGLRLPGTLAENEAALKRFCEPRRCLFVFAGIPPEHRDVALLRGKCSTILTREAARPPRKSEDETVALFSAWARDPDACFGALGDAEWHLYALIGQGNARWRTALQLGAAMAALLRSQDRLAEAHEVLEALTDAASDNRDTITVRRLAWEQGWIREQWGQQPPLRAPAEAGAPEQLTLFAQAEGLLC